jgi:hypothetical protein
MSDHLHENTQLELDMMLSAPETTNTQHARSVGTRIL